MAKDLLRYDLMVEAALRDVVRQSLGRAATAGLPGNHQFYITFRTDSPGVELPDHLRERYPDEMTIVLQHEFRDLEVGEDAFTVTLSFDDIPAPLKIPLSSITAFADPSVNFGLQFQSDSTADGAPRPSRTKADQRPVQAVPEPKDESAPEAAKVINLDTFRTK